MHVCRFICIYVCMYAKPGNAVSFKPTPYTNTHTHTQTFQPPALMLAKLTHHSAPYAAVATSRAFTEQK